MCIRIRFNIDPGRVLLHTITVVNIYEMLLSGAVYVLLCRAFLIVEQKNDGTLYVLLEVKDKQRGIKGSSKACQR